MFLIIFPVRKCHINNSKVILNNVDSQTVSDKFISNYTNGWWIRKMTGNYWSPAVICSLVPIKQCWKSNVTLISKKSRITFIIVFTLISFNNKMICQEKLRKAGKLGLDERWGPIERFATNPVWHNPALYIYNHVYNNNCKNFF